MDINLIAFIICVSVVTLALVVGSSQEARKRCLPDRYEYSLRLMRMAIDEINEQISSCDEGRKFVSITTAESYMEQRKTLITSLVDLTRKMQEISDRAARLPEGDEKVSVDDPYFDVSP